jgi:hypothetical protein
LLNRACQPVTVDDELDDAPLMLDAPRAIELRKKLLLAAAGARDIASYRARLELVVTRTDAAELAAIAETFLPRFRRFFAKAGPRLRGVGREMSQYFDHPGVRRIVGQSMMFYEVPASEPRRLYIQLIALPSRWTGPTRGEQVEHLSTVEIPHGKTSMGFTGTITLHEFFHYFYGTAPARRARELAAAFAASDEPGAPEAYGLLNEGLATAISVLTRKAYLPLAEWQAELAKSGDWYRDRPISMVAKGIYRWVEERLSQGASLYEPGFVPEYVRLARTAMGRALDRPAMKLRTLLLAAEDRALKPAMDAIRLGAASGRYQSAIPLEEPHIREALLQHPQQSGVIMVRGQNLSRLRPWEPVLGKGMVETLTSLHARHGALVQAVQRGPRSVLFVLVGDAPTDFEQLAARLLAAEEPFTILPLRR